MAICNNKKCSLGECDQPETCAAYVPVLTRADKILSMSDEDLAALISRSSIHDMCDIVCGGDCNAVATFNKTSEQRCEEIVLDWLKQRAGEMKKSYNKIIKSF